MSNVTFANMNSSVGTSQPIVHVCFTEAKNFNVSIHNVTNDDCIRKYEEYIYPTYDQWILIAAYFVTFVMGVVGNSLVCFAITNNRNMRTTPNVFILNLSVADLAVIIVCLPLTLVYDVTNTWFFGKIGCWIHVFITMLSINVSVLTLTAISIERWQAICHPLRFHNTPKRTRCIIFIIWMISVGTALPWTVAFSVKPYKPFTVYFSSCSTHMWSNDATLIYQLCIGIFFYFVPLALMAFAYTQIAIVLWTNKTPGQNESKRHSAPMLSGVVDVNTTETSTQTESRKKAAKMLIAVVVVFAICYLPNQIINIAAFTGSINEISPKILAIIVLFVHWLVFFNSCINPIIYNFMSGKFRKEFKSAMSLCCFCCRRRQHRWHDSFRVTYTANYRTISIRTGNVSNRRKDRTGSTKSLGGQPV